MWLAGLRSKRRAKRTIPRRLSTRSFYHGAGVPVQPQTQVCAPYHATAEASHGHYRGWCVWQLVLAHLWKLTLAHLWKLTGPDGDAMCPGLKRSESLGHIACDQSTCFFAPAFLHRAPETIAVRAGLDDVCSIRDAIQ